MRLSNEHRQALREQIRHAVGEACDILVFGSRLNDDARGGDLDLLVRSPVPLERKVWTSAMLEAKAQRLLEGRHVDVLLIDPLSHLQPVHHIALREGIPL